MTTEPKYSPNSGDQRGASPGGEGDCEQLLALLPAYSIGATDPEETRFVEATLENCPEAVEELRDYAKMAEEFLYLVPVRGGMNGNERVDDVPMPKLPSVAQMRQRSGQPSEKVVANIPAARQAPARRPSWVLPLVSAAAVLLLVLFAGSNVYWFTQLQQLYRDQRALAGRLEEVQLAMLPGTDLPFSGAEVQHRELVANLDTDVNPVAHATLFWDTRDEIGSLYVSGLPQLEPDKTYQLWLVREGHSLSLGKFRVDESGAATLTFESPEPIEGFQHVGVSTEPAEGSAEPTTPHLVIGNI